MKCIRAAVLLIVLSVISVPASSLAQGTAFMYQGRLDSAARLLEARSGARPVHCGKGCECFDCSLVLLVVHGSVGKT